MDLSDNEDLIWLSELVRDVRAAAPELNPLLVGAMACARIELDAMFLRCFLAQVVPDPQRQDQNAFRPAGGAKGLHFPPPAVGHIKRWNDGFRLQYIKG